MIKKVLITVTTLISSNVVPSWYGYGEFNIAKGITKTKVPMPGRATRLPAE